MDKKYKVLIVDDEQIIRDSLHLTLKRENFDFHFASNGVEAIKLVKKVAPILIILDIRMPYMDGLEVLKKLNHKPEDPYAVIVLTGHGTNQDVKKAYELGISNFIRKPFNIIELIGLVKSLIKSKSNENELRKANALLKEKQEQLIHTERIALLGEITSSLAHQLKQPLMLQKMSLEALKMSLEDDEFTKENAISDIDNCQKDLSHIQKTIDHILSVGHQDENNLQETFCLKKLIKEMHLMLDSYLSTKNIDFEIKCDDDSHKIKGSSNQIEQVLLNLISNSVHVLNNKFKENKILLNLYKEAQKVVIEVSDNGPGVDESLKDILFRSFITSKEKGVGTGLGLSIAKSIVDKHKGSICLDTEYAEGAKFIIEFPV